jgi:23S rRNA (adenine2503-C2)-methyltransferase
MCERQDIRSLPYEQLQEQLKALGMPGFRTRQIYEWIHVKLVRDFEEMTNISKADRERLCRQFTLDPMVIRDVQISAVDGTRKYLFQLADGNMIESVWMEYHHGNSVCISSQVGCRMGCKFCASTLDGLARNLTAGEMLAQIYAITKDTGRRVSNVVVMGSGEPLDNYDQLLTFLHMISDERGLCISQRNLTVSTCGLVPRILDLANEHLTITLAISLHAPNDALRKTMMPIAEAYSIEQILDACRVYYKETGRRLTFEYSLVKGVNDGRAQALELSGLLKNFNCHVNLIPVNPIKERKFQQSEGKNVQEFKKLLEKNGINATIRREMGRDIDGACGQLRKRHMDQVRSEDQ